MGPGPGAPGRYYFTVHRHGDRLPGQWARALIRGPVFHRPPSEHGDLRGTAFNLKFTGKQSLSHGDARAAAGHWHQLL